MSYFDFDEVKSEEVDNKSKVGAKPKHNFELMAVGDTKEFPNGVKTSSLRVMLSIKGKENNMRFKVSEADRTITRIA